MAELNARFSLERRQIRANFSLEQTTIPAIFKINAAGTTWGSISGNIQNQEDLYLILQDKASVESVETLAETVQNNYDTLDGRIDDTESALEGQITTLSNTVNINNQNINNRVDNVVLDVSANTNAILTINNTISGYGNIVTHNVNEFATAAQGTLADSALQPGDNISELVNNVGYITSASLPTVNDGKLSLQVNSVDVGEFTANQSTATTVNITVPTDTSDLTNGAGFLINNATGTNALAVGDLSQSTAEGGVAFGYGARANSTYSTAIGEESRATNTNTTVIGKGAKATQARAIAIGSGAEANAQDAIAIKGINNTVNTFQVYTYNMLDMATGLIPDARISTNIARTADMTTADNNLQSQIDNLKARGRFLALWNCATGLAESNPPESPYTYHAGDYFIVGVISTANPAVNYKPNGSSYTTGVASTTLETDVVDIDDVYYYDGTTWKLQVNTQKTISFVNIAGSPYDNTALGNALNAKADSSSLATVATSGDYSDLLNTPAINDGTLTIQVNGTTISTFTANQSTSTTANIVVPDSATWGNITGTLSDQIDLQNALNSKQDTLVSGTNIKTVNNNSLLGSGNIDIDVLPSQAGNSGKFLTTNGTTASWATIDEYTANEVETLWNSL